MNAGVYKEPPRELDDVKEEQGGPPFERSRETRRTVCPRLLSADTEDVCIVERLFSSSLVAIVSLKAPRKLKVCHFKKGTEICNYSYSNTILAVKLNRQRLIVCLEESLYIHNIRDMKVLHTIRETPPNPAGLCALSIHNDNGYLAYPGSATIGEVQVFDTMNLRAANMIPAHDSPLAALAFDASGTKLATASEKGTVIRVFSIPEGQKLFEFRRGVKRCVSICSLAFSMDSMFLSASSNTETVHIFKLETVKEKPQEEPTTWTGYFGKVLMASTSYLPSQVTEMFNQGRAFATVRLPFCGHKNICSLATIQKIPRLLVGASDGYLYMYNLDPQEGGECTLMKQHKLDGSMETTNEILDSASHDCPLVTQTYNTAVATGTHVPSSPTRLGVAHPASAVRELFPSSLFAEENLRPVRRKAPTYSAAVFLTFMNFGK
ncbi:WD repeat domain phosphoinositide-interacting protein 2 isoform X6 [Canis lupus familiaris]|uniref:WD repeat domain phosphoinositide-interacting protein 2 isoform X6 n=1 Tax=Canis lupus familiaris TaxID=9615 RepID=UPI0006B3C304|nr:WD repeat domain phosphoinositide-interacting protein 2 isoform X6 [Canis lupus familiaris]XP_038395499.1 WD repeat domain phosphoinositide-interacting protein 2 isoform X6 [Canis lupus familiaris]XP_038524289.1 WD repeat domain phosphoinositide-interacting protein 2 isoform X6 [Canis lupus familiaris]XP_048967132.1 WD repeat domain phosphoinositide-interacting protein 2 isoform X6 [Canis lupus dingo]|eukprot:XP_013969786.1 WD repeat domain phosphoinositide-interacting protein 2 isoform X4 [Canis lupus familiaris]